VASEKKGVDEFLDEKEEEKKSSTLYLQGKLAALPRSAETACEQLYTATGKTKSRN
jgi:hypothetical protein